MIRLAYRLLVLVLSLLIVLGVLYVFRIQILDWGIQKFQETPDKAPISIEKTVEEVPEAIVVLEAFVEEEDDLIDPADLPPVNPEEQFSALMDKIPEETETEFQTRLDNARQLLEYNYFSQAAFELSYLLRSHPRSLETYALLGEVYLQTNDLIKLESLISQIESKFEDQELTTLLKMRKWIYEEKFELIGAINSVDPEIRFYQGIIKGIQNDHEGAKQLFIAAFSETDNQNLQKKLNDFIAIYDEFNSLKEGENPHLLALYSKVLSQYDESLLGRKFADLAIQEEVGYIDAWILRGYSYYLSQDFDMALQDFRHAYNLDAARPQTTYFLAMTLYELENYTEAATYFEQALEYDFDFSENVRWKLVDIFTKNKKYDQALNLYKDLLDSESSPAKFTKAIDLAVNYGSRPDLALDFTTKLYNKNKKDHFSANLHVWALIATKNYVIAENILVRLMQEDPNMARTHLNYGLLREKEENYGEAKRYYKKGYEIGKAYDAPSSIINLAAESYNRLLKVKTD